MNIQKVPYYILASCYILFLSCKNPKIDTKSFKQQTNTDSINFWIKESKNNSYSKQQQKKFLQKAYSKNSLNVITQTKAYNASSIAYRYYELKDTTTFLKINHEALQLALQLNDSFTIADTHWSYADYYNNNQVFDKSYYHYNYAYEYFNGIKKTYQSARMLYAMAYIKGRFRDYSGSEILNIKAIEKFKKLRNYKYLYIAYNHLGVLQNDIYEYDKALFYHQKALEYYNKIKKKKYLGSFNNIGNVYLDRKQYIKAIENYNIDLNNNDITIEHYARVTDNKAYCKLLMLDTIGIKKDFFRALFIRDSIKDKSGVLMSKIRISDYYAYAQDTLKAIQYAQEANILANQLKNGRDYLASLKQLANLDSKNSKKYLDRYIVFNDSLISTERRIQNKFTRIAFETDEYIEETKRLTQQRIWIFVVSIGAILILSLLYFLRVQKVNNKALRLEADQQKANEEVYILTLQQQSKMEEERVKERNRISEELHDGILGKLFGARLGLGFLPIGESETTKEKYQSYLEELQEIEKEIRDVSHQLSDNFNDANINFTTIVKQLLEDKSAIGNFNYELHIDDTIIWSDVDEATKVNIYRIIQEALQNIIKHAQAKIVTLNFAITNEKLSLHIKDDGVGFNIQKGKKGIGLKNITSRMEKLKGSVQIVSEPQQGTVLHLIIPHKSNGTQ